MHISVLQTIGVDAISILALGVFALIVRWSMAVKVADKRRFILTALIAAMVIAAEAGTVYFSDGTAFCRTSNLVCNVIGFTASPFIPIVLGPGDDGPRPSWELLLLVPVAVNIICAVLSPVFGLIFTISPANIYSRGSLFVVYILAYLSAIALLFIRTARFMRTYQSRDSGTLPALLLFICVGTAVQVIYPLMYTSWLCAAFAVVLYYVYYCEIIYTHDTLTTLLNRRAYQHDRPWFEKADQLSVILFDVDNFKAVNDTYGHSTGDESLREVAQLMKKHFVKLGMCYRIGGDEFCVLSRCSDKQTIRQAMSEFLKDIQQCRRRNAKMPNVSYGYAVCKNGEKTLLEAIEEADSQLYCYKGIRKKHR